MRILFIDTHSFLLNVGVIIDDKLISSVKLDNINEHSRGTLVNIKECLDSANLKPDEIDKIIVTSGPGSFTGLRIGMTIAKTYAWTLNKIVIGVSSLSTYALSFDRFDYIMSIIDARRGFVYGAIYDKDYNEIVKEQYIELNALLAKFDNLNGKKIITSNDSFNFKTEKPNIDILKVVNFYKNNKGSNVHELKPNYLKKTEAEEVIG